MPDPRDRSSPQSLTLPSSPAGVTAATHPQLTMDPVTMPTGLPQPPSSQQRVDAYLGKTLEGRYAVEALLGEGGMGFVYLGRHKVIDKRVAIKILRSDLAADQEMTERFLNEARAASSIGNAHIVDISDFGRLADGAAFFVMEFLDGPSLSALTRNGSTVPLHRIIHIAKQIARGLAAAHGRGVVHRDLKPDNVMLIPRGDDPDFVKILDFGIAKLAGEQARLTRAGSVFGTPHYMSPEQAAGVPVDQRTDIYALGVILYEMVAGQVPFDADNFMGILTQHMYKAPPPLRTAAAALDVTPGLEAIVLKALSKKVEHRFQSMEELISDLEKLERDLVPDAVADMMARADGFNVPADYFQGATDSDHAPRRKGILYGAIAGLIVFAGIAGAVMIVAVTNGSAPAVATPSPVLDPEPGIAPLPAVSAPPEPAAVVTVTTDPVDATIALDDDRKDVPQQQPRTLMLAADEKVSLRVERAGYRTQRYAVDAKKIDPHNPRIVIRLAAETAKTTPPSTTRPPAKPAVAPPATTTAAPVSTLRPAWCQPDDWDPFLHKCISKK